MKKLVLSALFTFLTVATVQAQEVAAPPPASSSPTLATSQPAVAASQPAPATAGEKTLGVISQAANKTAEEIQGFKQILDKRVEDLNHSTSPEMKEILAVGVGAGMGFLVSGLIMASTISPLVWYVTTEIGLSEPAAAILTSSVTTVGVVSGTYAGGVYARDLVKAE